LIVPVQSGRKDEYPMSGANTAPTRKPNNLAFCRNGGPVWRGSRTEGAQELAKGEPETVKEYASFIKELLEAEEKRSSSMETRALAVVTTSGTLVTLLLALAALVTRVQAFRVPGAALLLAGISAGSFVAAALCAMLSNVPWRVWGLRPECLKKELWERWTYPDDDAVAKTTATRLAVWEQTHKLTQQKARFVSTATAFQFVAIAVLAGAVFAVLGSA
jgi:hypothetical protein